MPLDHTPQKPRKHYSAKRDAIRDERRDYEANKREDLVAREMRLDADVQALALRQERLRHREEGLDHLEYKYYEAKNQRDHLQTRCKSLREKITRLREANGTLELQLIQLTDKARARIKELKALISNNNK